MLLNVTVILLTSPRSLKPYLTKQSTQNKNSETGKVWIEYLKKEIYKIEEYWILNVLEVFLLRNYILSPAPYLGKLPRMPPSYDKMSYLCQIDNLINLLLPIIRDITSTMSPTDSLFSKL